MKKRLSLDAIKVKSFITKLEHEKKETIVGGESQFWCSWYISGCVLSLQCGKLPADVATPAQPGSRLIPVECERQIEQSKQFEALGLKCPYPAHKPGQPAGA